MKICQHKSILSSEEFAYTIIEELYKDTSLTPDQEDKLEGTLTELYENLECYRYKKPNTKSSILWRLSGIPYFLSCLLMLFIVLPIKWLLKGVYGFKGNTGFGRIMHKWNERI